MKTQQNNDPGVSNEFSLEQLNRICINDKGFIIKMVAEFITGANECNAGMRTFLFNKAWSDIKILAHKNILSFSVMGLKQEVGILKYIEKNVLNTEKRDQVADLIKVLCEKNNMVISEMRDLLKLMAEERPEVEIY